MTTIAETYPATAVAESKHPRGLYVLFGTELWERFSFYSMLAMYTLYLQNPDQGFGWTRDKATKTYALYIAFVYLSPLIGGWIADRKIGYRRAVMIGGFFFMAGHLLLSFRSVPIMYAALVCLVVGNGFFKPNVSAMVGKLYPEGSHLKDRAYNIFYMGINIGAFLAPLVAEVVSQRFGFHPAFAVAAGGMVVSVFILWKFKKYVEQADIRPKASREVSAVQGKEPGATLTAVDAPPVGAHDQPRVAIDEVPDWKRVVALIVIFLIVIIFWMAFHQNGATWTYWANDNTDWSSSPTVMVLVKILTLGLLKGEPSGIISNMINPFFVIVLTFPLIWFWGLLDRKGREPSTPAKMGFGMLMTALAYFVMFLAGRAGGDTGRVSPWWLIGAYAVITLGELMLSPMGLALVSKVAPIRLRGQMMGGWFVATSLGNYLVGTIGVKWNDWSHSFFFFVIAMFALSMAVVLVILLRPLKRAMPGV